MIGRVLVASALVASSFSGSSVAAGPPAGEGCHLVSYTDVTREAGWQVAEIDGGPVVDTQSGTLVCAVHVNNDSHGGYAAVELSGSTAVVSVLTPTLVAYQATAADYVYLCTRFEESGGTTWYYRAGALPGTGSWTTDPTRRCTPTTALKPNSPVCSVWQSVDRRLGTNLAEIWQDCETYPPII